MNTGWVQGVLGRGPSLIRPAALSAAYLAKSVFCFADHPLQNEWRGVAYIGCTPASGRRRGSSQPPRRSRWSPTVVGWYAAMRRVTPPASRTTRIKPGQATGRPDVLATAGMPAKPEFEHLVRRAQCGQDGGGVGDEGHSRGARSSGSKKTIAA